MTLGTSLYHASLMYVSDRHPSGHAGLGYMTISFWMYVAKCIAMHLNIKLNAIYFN